MVLSETANEMSAVFCVISRTSEQFFSILFRLKTDAKSPADI